MKKLFVITVSAVVAASAFAPVAQAKHRMRKTMAAPAPMAMAPMGNPRMDAQGQFYATPVGAAGPMGMGGMGMGPMGLLAVPGAAVGGAADVAGTGLDVLASPLK